MRRASKQACKNCGSRLPAKSRFCPECGVRVGASRDETAVHELPAHEEDLSPVERLVAQRRFFGVTPPTAIFGLAVAAVAVSLVLFAMGHWVWGLLLLAGGLLLFAGFVSEARRLPEDAAGVAKAPLAAFDAVRARTEAAFETVAAHGSARIELIRLRRQLGDLAGVKGERLRELGTAVYEGDRKGAAELKKRLRELDERIGSKESEMTRVAEQAHERIERAQLQVQPTQIVTSAEESPQEPEPARVPGPFPPPDEGETAQPARIPEPFPPPDEGDSGRRPTE